MNENEPLEWEEAGPEDNFVSVAKTDEFEYRIVKTVHGYHWCEHRYEFNFSIPPLRSTKRFPYIDSAQKEANEHWQNRAMLALLDEDESQS